MAREPQRRDEPRHLDAAIVPLERALIARAKALEAQLEALDSISREPGSDDDTAAAITGGMLGFTATQFRALAAELHHW